jgi:RimJ/RimL family protein N-acetyltransferase
MDADIRPVDSWYGEALASAHGLRAPGPGRQHLQARLAARKDSAFFAVTVPGAAQPAGLLEVAEGGAGELEFRFLGLEPERRGWGHGSEAARLLEEEASRRLGVSRFRAPVDGRFGLSLYFWLRLGYRPELPSHFPLEPQARPGGIIYMVRQRSWRGAGERK